MLANFSDALAACSNIDEVEEEKMRAAHPPCRLDNPYETHPAVVADPRYPSIVTPKQPDAPTSSSSGGSACTSAKRSKSAPAGGATPVPYPKWTFGAAAVALVLSPLIIPAYTAAISYAAIAGRRHYSRSRGSEPDASWVTAAAAAMAAAGKGAAAAAVDVSTAAAAAAADETAPAGFGNSDAGAAANAADIRLSMLSDDCSANGAASSNDGSVACHSGRSCNRTDGRHSAGDAAHDAAALLGAAPSGASAVVLRDGIAQATTQAGAELHELQRRMAQRLGRVKLHRVDVDTRHWCATATTLQRFAFLKSQKNERNELSAPVPVCLSLLVECLLWLHCCALSAQAADDQLRPWHARLRSLVCSDAFTTCNTGFAPCAQVPVATHYKALQ